MTAIINTTMFNEHDYLLFTHENEHKLALWVKWKVESALLSDPQIIKQAGKRRKSLRQAAHLSLKTFCHIINSRFPPWWPCYDWILEVTLFFTCPERKKNGALYSLVSTCHHAFVGQWLYRVKTNIQLETESVFFLHMTVSLTKTDVCKWTRPKIAQQPAACMDWCPLIQRCWIMTSTQPQTASNWNQTDYIFRKHVYNADHS